MDNDNKKKKDKVVSTLGINMNHHKTISVFNCPVSITSTSSQVPFPETPTVVGQQRKQQRKYQTNSTAATGTLLHYNKDKFISRNSHCNAHDKDMSQYVCHNKSTITGCRMPQEKLMIASRQMRIRVNTVNQQAFAEESNDKVRLLLIMMIAKTAKQKSVCRSSK